MPNRLNDPKCNSCYYPDKVRRQRECIAASQQANSEYKYKLRNLEIECSNLRFLLNIYKTMIPAPILHWLENRYYKKMRKEKINELRSLEGRAR